jgi:hypothetical protein
MKKRKVIAGAIIAIVVLGLAGSLLIIKKNDNPSQSNSSKTASKQGKSACAFFSQSDAESIAGKGVKKSEDKTEIKDNDSSVSTCSYKTDGTAEADTKTATVQFRAALSNKAGEYNKSIFGVGTPANTVQVQGYGDKAYWDASQGKLNVLQGNNWYTFSYGLTKVESRTQADAKLVADKVIKH